MNCELNMQLLERMAEGVILLDEQGLVTDFNAAAIPWVEHCLDVRALLRLQIDSVRSGQAQTPLTVAQWVASGGAKVDVFLWKAGTAQGYALFIAPVQSCAVPIAIEAGDADLFKLLGRETRHELTAFRESLSQTGADLTVAGQALRTHSDRVSRLLVAFDQLARLHSSTPFFEGERLSLPALVEEVLQEKHQTKCAYVVDSPAAISRQMASPLYGNAQWLKCALQVLIEGISNSAPHHSRVTLRIRQNGNYIVLSSHFVQESRKNAQSTGTQVLNLEPILHIDADIGVQISRRIVDMHGGQLIVADHPRLETFTLMLPLGTPAQRVQPQVCSHCPTTLQAEKYATDLVALMPHNPLGSGLLDEELSMLAEISFPVQMSLYPNSEST